MKPAPQRTLITANIPHQNWNLKGFLCNHVSILVSQSQIWPHCVQGHNKLINGKESSNIFLSPGQLICTHLNTCKNVIFTKIEHLSKCMWLKIHAQTSMQCTHKN